MKKVLCYVHHVTSDWIGPLQKEKKKAKGYKEF